MIDQEGKEDKVVSLFSMIRLYRFKTFGICPSIVVNLKEAI